jgi:transcriptional regulator with XRE-family HTH domain
MKHKLTQYQEENKLPNKELAKRLGLKGTNPTVTLLRWKNCQRIPHPKFMKQITKITSITPTDFYEAWYETHSI